MLVRVECKNGHVWFEYYGAKQGDLAYLVQDDDPRCETCGEPIELATP